MGKYLINVFEKYSLDDERNALAVHKLNAFSEAPESPLSNSIERTRY
jgi:hypothetical protein